MQIDVAGRLLEMEAGEAGGRTDHGDGSKAGCRAPEGLRGLRPSCAAGGTGSERARRGFWRAGGEQRGHAPAISAAGSNEPTLPRNSTRH